LTGRTLTIGKARGKPIAMSNGVQLIVTIHPSALPRIKDDDQRHAAYRSFVADLKVAAAVCSREMAPKKASRDQRAILQVRKATEVSCRH
jgi:hypothetical protein